MTSLFSRRGFLGGGCALCAATLAGCQTTGEALGRLAPGARPVAGGDVASLWESADREERRVRQSRHIIRTPEVTSYISGLVEQLAGPYAKDIRVYIVRTPEFNAGMYPNGMMQVWTGLMLRCANEAQLAAVLGHEIGHYIEQHTVANFRSIRSATDIATFVGMGLAVAAGPGAAVLAQLAIIAAAFSFSRDQEREADAIGLDLIARNGYAPLAAAQVWERMIAERAAEERDRARGEDIFFATHPSSAERAQTLTALAGGRTGEFHTDRYRQALGGLQLTLVEDELRLRRFRRSEWLFERLHADGANPGLMLFARAEVNRLRDFPGDQTRAAEFYRQATAQPGTPPEAWRGLGLIERKRDRQADASAAFRRYLDLKPDAGDRDLIRSYL